MHIELLSWSATAPGAGGAAAAALTGDSLIVKNNIGVRGPAFLALWGLQQASGFQQISFPSGHDTTRGYRYNVEGGETDFELPPGFVIPLTAQENLSITIAGSAVAGDVESGSGLILYPQLPGVESRGIMADEAAERMEKMTTIQLSCAPSGAGYSGSELITADSDLLMANRDYAILGGRTTADVCSVGLKGPDTGNVRVGFPGADNNGNFNCQFFTLLSRALNLPIVPVINSGNKSNTFVDVVSDENAAATPITLYLALLKRK